MTDEIPQSDSATAVVEPQQPTKLKQTIRVEQIGPCKKQIHVTIDRAEIDARIDHHYTEIVKDMSGQMKGFRPGKIPRKIVERRFAKEVMEQVRSELLMASLEQIATDEGITPLGPPDIDMKNVVVPETGPMTYHFKVEVRPDFEMPNYKGIKLKRLVKDFSEEDIDREQTRLLEPYATKVPKAATNGEPTAELGDALLCDITILSQGEEVTKAENVSIRMRERLELVDGVIEDFAKSMVGIKAGETRTLDMKINPDAQVASLRGATVQAAFAVKQVQVLQMPEINEELLSKFGCTSLPQLRELIYSILQRRLDYTQRQFARNQIVQIVSSASSWELPQDLLERQSKRVLQRRGLEMRNQGLEEEEIGQKLREMARDVTRQTAIALREQFILQKVAELEKIEITDEDLDREIENIAERTNESFRKVKARMEKEDAIEALAGELLERKALDLILASAEYEDMPLPTETPAAGA